MIGIRFGVLVCVGLAMGNGQWALGQSPTAQPDWRTAEALILTNHRQLTSRDMFTRAGEAYFNADSSMVIFQATPVPEGDAAPSPHYEMFVAPLGSALTTGNNGFDVIIEAGGENRIKILKIVRAATGLGLKDAKDMVDNLPATVKGQLSKDEASALAEELRQAGADVKVASDGSRLNTVIRVSTGGSANTCGWFHPIQANIVLFGSTIEPPSADKVPGYQRGTGRYAWSFPTEMEIVSGSISSTIIPAEGEDGYHALRPAITDAVFSKPGYTAEASWSPDGRTLLYAQVDEAKSDAAGRPDADLWAYDTETGAHYMLVEASGYDGGPFFSPDGTKICYRSDRAGNNLLQLFVADLKLNEDGVPVGITKETQLTSNEHVNWAPYWHPDGDLLVYATSQVGHRNYEVFAIWADASKGTEPVRITQASGADVLPVFSPDGRYLMWTAQRGELAPGEQRPSSQLWIAEVDSEAIRAKLREAN
ncbi:MAG: ribosomal protein L7/L12 [Phycisphaera sp.]|nr:MAG: ribosomal protein L7/L12 [Phycisphaera sp.]